MGLHEIELPIDLTRQPRVVSIQEGDVLALSCVPAGIASGGCALVRRQLDEVNPLAIFLSQAVNFLRRVIGAAIVDEDEFSRLRRLRSNAGNRTAKRRSALVAWDHHAYRNAAVSQPGRLGGDRSAGTNRTSVPAPRSEYASPANRAHATSTNRVPFSARRRASCDPW